MVMDMATTTYLLITPDMEEEIEADSLDHARQVAARRIRAEYAPLARRTYWVPAELWDYERAAHWPEPIDPEPPDCDPVSPEIGRATVEELERAWGLHAWDDGRHVWGAPRQILGGHWKYPGQFGHGGGVVVEELCLRCGTLEVTDTWATDPWTGTEGLRSIEYHPGRYAKEVAAQGGPR